MTEKNDWLKENKQDELKERNYKEKNIYRSQIIQCLFTSAMKSNVVKSVAKNLESNFKNKWLKIETLNKNKIKIKIVSTKWWGKISNFLLKNKTNEDKTIQK